MTSEEDILIRLGVDQTSMRAGTNAAMDFQKKASMEYVGFWESAMVKKTAAESAMNDKSIAAARAVSKSKIEIAEAEAARIKIINEGVALAGAGSGGFGGAGKTAQDIRDANRLEKDAEIVGALGSGAAGAAYAFNKAGKLIGKIDKDGKLIKNVESAGEGLEKVGHAAGGKSSIFREIQVLIHEGLAERWKQFISSFSRLLMFMGLTAETLLTSIPIIGAAVAAGIGMIYAARGMEDNRGEVDIDPLRKRIGKIISGLQKSGKLDVHQADTMLGDLSTVAGVRKVQGELSKIPGAFDDPEVARKAAEKARELARVNNQAWKEQLASERESMGHQDRITSLIKEHRAIGLEMARLDSDSVEYAQKLVEQRELAKQVEQERKEMAKEQIELQKEYNDEVKDVEKIQRSISQIDVSDALPSIEDLAGRSFTENLNSQYGAPKWERRGRRWVKVGGEFDLGAGDGPFAQAAQDAERAKKQEQWDIINGNAQWQYNPDTGENELVGGQALEDRSRRVTAENLLSRAGLETPEMKADKMNKDIAQINIKIGQLLTQAQHDGIVIKTAN